MAGQGCGATFIPSPEMLILIGYPALLPHGLDNLISKRKLTCVYQVRADCVSGPAMVSLGHLGRKMAIFTAI